MARNATTDDDTNERQAAPFLGMYDDDTTWVDHASSVGASVQGAIRRGIRFSEEKDVRQILGLPEVARTEGAGRTSGFSRGLGVVGGLMRGAGAVEDFAEGDVFGGALNAGHAINDLTGGPGAIRGGLDFIGGARDMFEGDDLGERARGGLGMGRGLNRIIESVGGGPARGVTAGVGGALDVVEGIADISEGNGEEGWVDLLRGVSDVVGSVGGAVAPFAKALSLGLTVGETIDDTFQISDRIGEMAGFDGAAVGLDQHQHEVALAAGGDDVAAALVRDRELLASYEDRGAQIVNARWGGANMAHAQDPEDLQELGQQAMFEEELRRREEAGMSVFERMTTPTGFAAPDDLREQIEERAELRAL